MKAKVVELAKTMAERAMIVEGLGMAQRPLDVEKRIESQAAYSIAQDKLRAAQSDYERAFSEWHQAGFPD